MSKQKFVYLFAFLVFIQSTAQDKDSEVNSKTDPAISGNLFGREATFVDYIFKQEKSYYTKNISSGFSVNYNKGLIEFGAALNQMNSWACFTAICYTIDAKTLDENWIRVFSGFGEVALIPEQQSNPDLWIYTAGLVLIHARPFKWGTPALALTAGGAYSKSEINLNIRAFFNLAVPIF
jgi:hypothetical protein